MKTLHLKIFNILFTLSTDSLFTFENLEKDFKYYMIQPPNIPTPSIKIKALKEKPIFTKIPLLEASLYSLGAICYRDKSVHYIDYSGKGLMIFNFKNETGTIFSEDENLLYEKTRLALLSRLGEKLDHNSIHRIHAAGLRKGSRTCICLLPMEAGKTTIALNALKIDKDIKLLSDDICFIDPRLNVHPFYLRIGVRDQDLLKSIPPQYVQEIHRKYYGKKHLIDPEFFSDQLTEAAQASHILIGKRYAQEKTEIKKIAKWKCFIPFLQSGVFGLGLPQIVELFLRSGLTDSLIKTKMVFSRTWLFFLLILKTKTFEIRIGRDKIDTAEKIVNFLGDTNVS